MNLLWELQLERLLMSKINQQLQTSQDRDLNSTVVNYSPLTQYQLFVVMRVCRSGNQNWSHMILTHSSW